MAASITLLASSGLSLTPERIGVIVGFDELIPFGIITKDKANLGFTFAKILDGYPSPVPEESFSCIYLAALFWGQNNYLVFKPPTTISANDPNAPGERPLPVFRNCFCNPLAHASIGANSKNGCISSTVIMDCECRSRFLTCASCAIKGAACPVFPFTQLNAVDSYLWEGLVEGDFRVYIGGSSLHRRCGQRLLHLAELTVGGSTRIYEGATRINVSPDQIANLNERDDSEQSAEQRQDASKPSYRIAYRSSPIPAILTLFGLGAGLGAIVCWIMGAFRR